jgi:hypothetical protein
MAALGALAVWIGSATGGPSMGEAQPALAADGFAYGVIVDTTNPRGMKMAREAGFTHAKMIVHWPRLEPKRGRFTWKETSENDLDNVMKIARAEKMLLVVRVDDVPDWAGGAPAKADTDAVATFYEAMAAHGKGVVVGYEILNEPNLPFEWGGPPSPSGYAAFLKAAYRGIKKSDPDAVVIGGGVSPNTGGAGGTIEDFDFLRGMYAAGARGSMDALSVHNYGGNFEPEHDPASCSICFRRAELYRQVMVEAGDTKTSVWSTEFGWLMDPGRDMGQYDWMKVSADRQAEYVVRAFKYGREKWPWLGGLLLSNLDASTSPYHTDPQNGMPWFAILNKDYSPRPAYTAFKKMRDQDPDKSARAVASTTPTSQPTRTPTPTPTPTAEPTPESVATAMPTAIEPTPTSTRSTAPAGPASVERVRVVGTDGDGVSLRAEPSTTARRLEVLPEGTVLEVVGPDRQAEGRTWRNVRKPGGPSGWVAAQYLGP